MENQQKDPIEQIEDRLTRLQPVPERDPERHASGRAAFLAQARRLKAADDVRSAQWEKTGENLAAQAVSEQDNKRHIGWISVIKSKFMLTNPMTNSKEKPVMLPRLAATVLIIVAILFGGVGATAYAAQDSLPADALYSVKTITEDLSMGLSAQEQARLDLALTYAERRVGEIGTLAGLGMQVRANVVSRLGEQVEEALTLAANMTETSRRQGLQQVIARMQVQAEILAQVESANPHQTLLTQARLQLQEQIRLAELGLTNPAQLQERLRERAQLRPWAVVDDRGGNANGNGNGNANGNTNTNTNTNTSNANGNGTNANGNGDNGNGNGTNANGNGDDDGNGNGTNANGNGDDDGNGNGTNANGNGDDDGNGNGTNANGNGSDDDGNGNGSNANSNGSDDDGNGNGDDRGNDNGGNDNGSDDNGNGDDRGNDNGGNDNSGSDDRGNDNGGGDDNGGNDNGGGDDNGGNDNGGNDDRGNDNGGGGDDNGGSGGSGKGGSAGLPAWMGMVLSLLPLF